MDVSLATAASFIARAPRIAESRSDAAPLPVAVASDARRAGRRYEDSPRRMRWPLIALLAAMHFLVFMAIALERGPMRPPRRPGTIAVVIEAPEPKPTPAPAAPKPIPVRHVAPVPVTEPPPIVVPDLPREIALPTITLPPEPIVPPSAPSPPALVAVAPVVASPVTAPLVPPRFDASYLDNPAPAYPSLARRHREEGRVLLRVRVAADGSAEQVDVAASSGSERLDRAALDAVRRWRFVPARRGAEAVAATVQVPIVFLLDRA
ncbi:MAG: TonB family protein [Betaproteobacteria bacterium]